MLLYSHKALIHYIEPIFPSIRSSSQTIDILQGQERVCFPSFAGARNLVVSVDKVISGLKVNLDLHLGYGVLLRFDLIVAHVDSDMTYRKGYS